MNKTPQEYALIGSSFQPLCRVLSELLKFENFYPSVLENCLVFFL